MNTEPSAQLQLLLDLESRHEDLLVRLEELDRRVERILAESLTHGSPEPPATMPVAMPQ